MHTVPPPYTSSQLVQRAMPVTPELSVALSTDTATHDVLISLVPPCEPLSKSKGGQCNRTPVDICCVIDVSGSMDSELKASLEEGKAAELTGLSTLDVVKHAVKTIVATMEPDDRISIVTFSATAKVMVGLTPMTTDGKEEILKVLQTFHTISSTNIWDGLKTGMDVLNGLKAHTASSSVPPTVSAARISTLFLLTDGMPNMNPPRGIIQMLKSYIDIHSLNFSIHSFGFGYALDSQLLLQIARLGQGIYGFIPDASALGAVFIHAVANLYSVCADQVEVDVEYPTDGSAQITLTKHDIFYGQDFTPYSGGAKLQVGSVQYGQTRDFVFQMKDYPQLIGSLKDPVVLVTVRYRPWTHSARDKLLSCTASLSKAAIAKGVSEEECLKLKHHSYRFTFIRAVDDLFGAASTSPAPKRGSTFSNLFHIAVPKLKSILPSRQTPATAQASGGAGRNLHPERTPRSENMSPDTIHTAIPSFELIISSLQTPLLFGHAPSTALAEDIAGEVLLGLSSAETYARWGQHYLPSLARWHLLQQCGSYRDPGLQVYGADSPLFASSRDALDQAFDSLPPPEPSINHQGRASPQLGSMATAFAARSGPCFDGSCKIMMADGCQVPVGDLRRGMRVYTPNGTREVVAVLETRMQGGEALLCELPGGLRITPWHPIMVSGGEGTFWTFPANIASPEVHACHAVYSLLLSPDSDPEAHAVHVQNVRCVTLGHGITQKARNIADVRAHEFLGDYQRIVRSLASLSDEGADEGVFHIGGVVKDSVSGMICGLLPYERTPLSSSGAKVEDVIVVT